MLHRFSWRSAALVLVSLGATAGTPSPLLPTVPTRSILPAQGEQDKQGEGHEDSTSQGFVLEVGEHSLADIIRDAGKFLGRNYFFNRAEVENGQNVIEIQKKLNLDVIGCEDVVSQLAYLKGFAIVPIDPLRGLYDVISTRGQRMQEIAIGAVQLSPDEVLRKSKRKMVVLTSVPLEYIDAARASQQLRPFFSAGGGRNGISFGTAGNSASLILQGYAGQVANAIRMLRVVDVAEQTAQPKPYYAQVQRLSQLVTRQANSIKAMQARLTALEVQFAAVVRSAKKK